MARPLPPVREYNAKVAIGAEPDMIRERSTRERLEGQRQYHINQITEIEQALGLLDRNPDTEQLLNLLGRISY